MTTRILAAALGLAWLAAVAGVVWLMILGGMRPHHALLTLIDMDSVLKTFAGLSVVSAAVGIIGLRAGARRRGWIGIGAAVGWGVLGGLYGAAGARSVLINTTPPIPFSVYAPNYAAALIVLLIGLSAALLCLTMLSFRRRP